MAFRTEEKPWESLQEIYAPTFYWPEEREGRDGGEEAHDFSRGSSPGGAYPGESSPGSSSRGGSTIEQSPVDESSLDESLVDESPLEETPSDKTPRVEFFWPNIAPHIGQGGKRGKEETLRGSCNICYQHLGVDGLPEPKLEEGESCQTCHYTPCGHMFCRPCFKRAIEGQRERNPNQPETCPTCRLELSCRQCGRMCKIFAAQVPSCPTSSPRNTDPAHDRSAASAAPARMLTIPEGAPYSLECKRCVSRRSWMRRLEQGRWPASADSMEPGFAPFLYCIMDRLESARRTIDRQAIEMAFSKIMDDEFENLSKDREDYIESQTRRLQEQDGNPWF
ncbi:hypothetical protein G7Z17_g5229 [Cylindrodendrum hubeiense]|uniref:RING-type domain-containing protein n=1 Tax=Cylindrodendrum hubeiense TaxID=595255 RepID=A0A9P5HCA7_9HYPO|nr:hypothetical protein G7Z17_g5229 [Cylindrodendrum hubeiense]